ncbi:putative uncharacterized protein [Blautia hydrogenotrophica CAG:147]|uniref:sodium:solute symporter family protein n=1 Tax=Blautia hydrogenotrophica TaxID=53443 RepID=UPI00033F8396|nr:sodium:solute symporter family protein [Blautia hydrogenotrophica]CCX59487.1 putative uncharacterized protein [Blautia hydrogenotrophica CAG:147]CUM93282.1 Proline permease [Blautia hydrogenotrophica]SCH48712.1 Proline permease [uncultured Blautia sp.]
MEGKTYILVIAGIYMLLMIAIGFIGKQRAKKATDYLLCGRNLGILMTSATIAATQIGAGVIVGGATTGMESGIWPGMYYALSCGLGCIVSGCFIAGKMRAAEAVVPMDYFEARYGQKKITRFWAWLSNVPSLLGVFVAQILACGSIFSAFGVSYHAGALICAIVILIYSSLGGMWSVAIGDFIQIIIIIVCIPICAIIAVTQAGDAGAVFGTPFIPQGMFGQFVYLVSPMLVSIAVSYDAFMRYQSSKDYKTAKWGCIIGGLVTIVIGTFASAIGVAGHILFPDASSESIFAYTIGETAGPVLSAFAIVAVLAAAMSSGNGLLIGLGASFSKDFYNGLLHPDKKMEELPHSKTIARTTIILACILGTFISFKLTNILDAIILFNYPYMGSMLIPLYASLLSKNSTAKGCYFAMVGGGIVGVFAFMGGLGLIPLKSDWGLFIAYAVSLVIMFAVSAGDKQNRVPMVKQDF